MHDIEVFKRMLDDFKAIRLTEPVPPTFMEISGYPHLENVCSNILSFFLTVDECHGLGDVLLQSILLAAGRDVGAMPFQDVVVERENCTDQRQRLDLVIESDRFIIGIENKVFSSVNNDLKHYADHIRKRKSEDREVVLILLTLYPVKGPESKELHTFIPVTYEQWFAKLQLLLGQYALTCDQRYLIYLLDFMRTVERLGRKPEMNSEVIEFLRDNQEAVHKLAREVKAARAELKREASRLAEFVQYDESLGIRQWVYTDTDLIVSALVHDLPFMGERQLAVDAYITLSGWRVRIFTRKAGSESLRDWLTQRGIEVATSNGNEKSFDYQSFEYGSDKDKVGAALTELLRKLAVTL